MHPHNTNASTGTGPSSAHGFALITHASADGIFAWRDGAAVTAGQFLSDVARLRTLLPAGEHMLNACSDRYHFAVGLAAALCSKKICLLPSNHTPEMIRQLMQFAPDAFCLTDNPGCRVALPQLRFPPAIDIVDATDQSAAQPFSVPAIDSGQTAAYVFTSGSTGRPLPHRKTWGALVRNVQAGAALCGMADGRRHAVIGTVPPQHMFGFESTVLIVMQSANILVAGDAFYPADICRAIAAAPRPRVLVSTPVHLRAVLGAGMPIPEVDLVISATAPLSLELALAVEAGFKAPLLEISGSTETGQIAMRNSASTREWTLFRDVQLTCRDEIVWASGGHVEQPTPMNDRIDLLGNDRFLLHGRITDMINVAGKRNSLAYLDLQLLAIAGVTDGAFFMPDTTASDGMTRPTAFVVAPSVSAAALTAALRERIDPAFLPRPLIFVDVLPRNAAGKLPRDALQTLAAMRRPDAEGST